MLDPGGAKRASAIPEGAESETKRPKIEERTSEDVDAELSAILGPNGIPNLETTSGSSTQQDAMDIDFDNLPPEMMQGSANTQSESQTQPKTPSQSGVGGPLKSESIGQIPQVSLVSRPAIRTGAPSAPVAPLVSTTINRMDPMEQQAHSIQGLNTTSIHRPPGGGGSGQERFHTNDPSKLNDALAAAGVDIGREEELLQQQQYNRGPRINVQPSYLQLRPSRPLQRTPFLNSYHLGTFMQRVARENGVLQSFMSDSELLELMSASCEQWISHIATKTVLLSRHRRKGIPALKNKKIASSLIPRSEVSKELRSLALKQKDLEERRVSRRILLGLENKDANLDSNKVGAEETLHRAANETAAMMTSNKKKYLWMSSGSGTGDETRDMEREKDKQSHLLALRGDNGLRFRDIRTGDSVTMKDLLSALEDERMGVIKAVTKGYARLKD